MTIKREDIDRRIVDFSDIASGRPSSTCPSRRNPARQVPDPDGNQRLRARQCDQGASLSRQ